MKIIALALITDQAKYFKGVGVQNNLGSGMMCSFCDSILPRILLFTAHHTSPQRGLAEFT